MAVAESALEQAESWLAEGRRLALATVIRTWGSSPRPAGSQLVVSREGDFAGSVSGGCVEGSVISESAEVMDSGAPKRLHFGVTDEMAWEVGLACGGEVEIYIEKLETGSEFLGRVRAQATARRGAVRIVHLPSGRDWVLAGSRREAAGVPEEVLGRWPEASRSDASTVATAGGEDFFLHVLNPPPRVVIVGAVHIAPVSNKHLRAN